MKSYTLLPALILPLLLHVSGRPLAGAEATKLPIPPATNILAGLKQPHPRLLATQADIAQLKERIAADAQLRSWHAKLQAQAKSILGAEPSRYEIPDGLRLLSTSRRVVQRVQTLGLLYRLDGHRRYAARAWQELAAAAAFPDWNPRHFLDTAEMTHAFAIGYDWLYDFWTPEQRATLRRAMVEKGLTPALKLYGARKWWTRAHNNWNQVCNGGIGMGALALAEVEPELAGKILHAGLESIQIAMGEFAPDGACKEGPGYWNYATSYNVLFLAGLQTALGTDFGLRDMPGFSDTGLFPIYISGPLGRTFNYADAGEGTIRAPQMFWLAREFKRPLFAWYERQVAVPFPLDLVWFDPAGVGPKAAGLPLDKYFRAAEVAVLRSAWEDPKAVFVGFKAGDNKASHSHLDPGSFVLDAAGVRWASDLGPDNYNLPAYFGNQRWNYYRLRAEGQNTLVLNPGQDPGQDPAAATKIIRFKSTPSGAYAIADLTPAYAKHASRLWRGIALQDRNKVLVQDEIQAPEPVELWWFMHTPASVQVGSDGRHATLRQSNAQLRAEILSPADAKFQVMEAAPLPTSPNPKGQAKIDRVRKLAIHLTGVSDSRIAVLLVPQSSKAARPGKAPALSPLSQW